MWFWFGLEILRLVYKKVFFFNIEQFLFYLTFLPPKNSTDPYKSRKNVFKIERKGYQKKQNFTLISKMCRNLASRNSQRFFSLKNSFLLNFLSAWKIRFSVNFFPLLLNSRLLHIFEISAKFRFFDTLCGQFWRKSIEFLQKFQIKITGPYCGAWMVLIENTLRIEGPLPYP